MFPYVADVDVRYHGQHLLRKSLSRARQFLVLVDKEIASARQDSRISAASIQALEGCRDLSWLNIKHLVTVHGHVGRNESTSTIGDRRVSEAHTLLSTVLTNQQTCADTLKSSRTRISERVAEDTKLYSVVLSFFAKAWVRGADGEDRVQSGSLPNWNQLRLFQEDKMEEFTTYKSVFGRRNINLDNDKNRHQRITVGEVVVVSKDGIVLSMAGERSILPHLLYTDRILSEWISQFKTRPDHQKAKRSP
ncbi:hypothetical protein MLD38_001641 [Melastoma candidum]|uniref:Uncharacterized protein n=1 Tax=Melastoma candidum TaxID=119954 RepID=A0ACB9SDT8_9MYRT|nr:hypothetical protein MLD38_001641 [Melastoma candidum]